MSITEFKTIENFVLKWREGNLRASIETGDVFVVQIIFSACRVPPSRREHGRFAALGFTGLSRPVGCWLWHVSLPSCSAGCDWSEHLFSQSQHHPNCMFTSPSGFLHKPQRHHEDSLQRSLLSYLKVTYLHMFSRHSDSDSFISSTRGKLQCNSSKKTCRKKLERNRKYIKKEFIYNNPR